MSDDPLELSALPTGSVQGRNAFEEAVRVSIEQAALRGWNSLCWMDSDFSDWPLGERRTHDALQAWSRTGKRFVIMANNFDHLLAKHHRFVSWRRQWAHIIECWRCPLGDRAEFPSLIFAPEWCIQRRDKERFHCYASVDEQRIQTLEELQQHWLEKSSLSFPANVLGL